MKHVDKFLNISAILIFSFLAGCETTNSTKVVEKTAKLEHRQGVLVINAAPGDVVKVEQQRHEFWFGAAITNRLYDGKMSPEDVAKYQAAFLENFNSAVTENALKWLSMQPRSGPVNYAILDSILEWTDANDIPLRGHNIYWGIPKFVQPWVKDLDDEALRAELKHRGQDIAERYKGRFAQYDLNNEMIHGNYYADRLGESITLEMTQWFMAVDPDAKLFLNDYDILTGARLDQYVEHIEKLLDEGAPIAGIGVQGHLHTGTFDREVLKSSLGTLAQFDLPIVITEFNFPGQRSKYHKEKGVHPFGPKEEAIKAEAIVDYYRICFQHPDVEGILMWGFWGGENWIPESSLYNKDWSETPALKAYQDLIYKEWWTSEEVVVDKSGVAKVSAFYGNYNVSINGVNKDVELPKSKGSVTVSF